MKKTGLTIIFCLMALLVQAQSGQMTFLGIALGDSIGHFEAQMLSKGIITSGDNDQMSRYREYKGTIDGEKADIQVNLDRKDSIVTSLNIFFERTNLDECNKLFNHFKDRFAKEYPHAEMEWMGDAHCTMLIPSESTDDLVGAIYLGVKKDMWQVFHKLEIGVIDFAAFKSSLQHQNVNQ